MPGVGANTGSVGITATDLGKSYGAFVALANVSLQVRAGEFLTLLGPSGSGKTTLLNIIAGFVRPDAGVLKFGEQDVTDLAVHERGLGMVFQNYALFPHMSVWENIAFPLKVRKRPRQEIEANVKRVLDLVRLAHLAGRAVTALSGGERQRVALARAVVFEPRIVMMDEPLSALDRNLREQMQVEIRHLHKQIGATTIYVTHDQREALTMSDRIAIMHKGRIVQCDTPEQIYDNPADSFVAGFIGETAMLDVERHGAQVMLRDGTLLTPHTAVPADGAIVLAIRAERLLLPEERPGTCNQIPSVISEIIYQGDSLMLLAEVAGGQTVAIRKPLRVAGEMNRYQPGQAVTLGLEPSATLVVRKVA